MKKPAKKPTRRETTQAIIEDALRAGLDLTIETSWYGRAALVTTRRHVALDAAGTVTWTANQAKRSPNAEDLAREGAELLSATLNSGHLAEVAGWVADRITSITHVREAIKRAEKGRKAAGA